jgi:phosphoribosylglycinamide formyltransferase-1
MKDVRLGILGSGKGTNCRAILESIRSGVLAAEVRVVISDVFDAPILEIAREFLVPNAYLPPGRFHTRLEPQAEADLVRMLRDSGVELVVLAGFMRVLKATALEAFPRRILNIHPSLLPKFPGLEAWKQALVESATALHRSLREKNRHGDVVAPARVRILPNDTRRPCSIRVAEHSYIRRRLAGICRQLSE